jgi:hypothetical protein
MDARRARHLVVVTLSVALLLPFLATSAAAATCKLTAPATVAIGSPNAITGSGFPANASVDVALTFDGSATVATTVQSDAGGTFLFSFTPTAVDAGRATAVATAGTDCTAQIAFTVGVSTGAAGPEAGVAGATGSGAAQPPRTDSDGHVRSSTASTPAPAAWPLALLLLLLGIGGLLIKAPARNR